MSHQMSDTDSDTTIDPSENAGNVLPTDIQHSTASRYLDHNLQTNDNSNENKLPFRFKRSYTVHSVSDSESDDECKQPSKKLLCSNADTSRKGSSKTSTPNITESESGNSSSKKAVPKSESPEDKRPICPYGNACYRKSSSHVKNFRHKQIFEEPIVPIPCHVSNKSLSADKILSQAKPFNFLLTKVSGISQEYNKGALHISDILSPCMGNLKKSAQFNYCHDIHWLMEQYPSEFQSCPLTLVHGHKREEKRALEKEAQVYPQLKLCQAKLEIPFGTHHTKMMFLCYDTGLRVVIHTANLVEKDWYQKTQGIWVSPLFPKLAHVKAAGTDNNGESRTGFKKDLLAYIEAYKTPLLDEWLEILQNHDFSSANVILVGSVPGRHVGNNKYKWGHMKMRNALGEHGPDRTTVKSWPIISQFSSVGSLGPTCDTWLKGEWLESVGSYVGAAGGTAAKTSQLKFVFPCYHDVRLSLEGYPAGQSIPYSYKTAQKQPYLHTYWHLWRSNRCGRTRAMPHIKTYFRISPDNKEMAWFLVTSANMSKAAWGVSEKGGSQIMIRSYELGVLFLPKYFGSEMFSVEPNSIKGTHQPFPLPYDLPLIPYCREPGKMDRVWLWDIPYVKEPDSNGNMWCPSLD